MSHYPDWYPLRYAVKAVVDKYPHVKFVIWGTKFDWITTVIPENQLEYHEWTDYAAYKMKRSIMDCDINLAPLVDAPFNWCKSGIKFYEASIGPRPEATLAANVQPYSLEIEDGKTGLLYNSPEEFAQKLGLLIENATLRKNLAAGAKKWVEANRTPDATIPGLAEFYEELRRQRRMEALAI
jgi:glycosyltransferase involved in cell wall biosynthesis